MLAGVGKAANGVKMSEETDNTNDSDVHLIPLNISHQYTKDLSFENPSTPQLFLDETADAPSINIDVRVTVDRLSTEIFEVLLHTDVNATAGERTLFLLEHVYAGIAKVDQVPEVHLHPFIMIEVPKFLFPFSRAIISEIVTQGGFPSLLLTPVDFAEMYRQSAKKNGS